MKRLVHRNVVKVVATFSTLSRSNGYDFDPLTPKQKSITLNEYTNTYRELAFNILQEYCEGGDLSSRVKRARNEPRYSLKQRVVESWFAQILSGLSYIHKNGVIHRDICAKNIFLCRNDKIVKIGDFGVSKECGTCESFYTKYVTCKNTRPPPTFKHQIPERWRKRVWEHLYIYHPRL